VSPSSAVGGWVCAGVSRFGRLASDGLPRPSPFARGSECVGAARVLYFRSRRLARHVHETDSLVVRQPSNSPNASSRDGFGRPGDSRGLRAAVFRPARVLGLELWRSAWEGACDNDSSGRGVAQPGSAPALGAGGRWFESSRPDQNS
jgi:hypothetical protein